MRSTPNQRHKSGKRVRPCLLPRFITTSTNCPPPLRIEFPGAIYHVTSRGDRREPIFEDDENKNAFLVVIGQTMDRFDFMEKGKAIMLARKHRYLPPLQPDRVRLNVSAYRRIIIAKVVVMSPAPRRRHISRNHTHITPASSPHHA